MSGQWQTAAASIDRIQAVLNAQPTLVSPPQPASRPGGASTICFDNVTLDYGDLPVLRARLLWARLVRVKAPCLTC